MLPIGWRWLVGFYLGIPTLLVILRPEIMPNSLRGVATHLFTTVVVTIAIGGPLHVAYAYPMPRLLPRLRSRLARVLAHALTIVTCVAVGKSVAMPLVHGICEPHIARDSAQESLIAVAVAAVVVLTTTSYSRLVQRTREIERRAEEAQQAALRAQLEALQSRTNPHFLFNSLNTVASLIATDPACAEQTLERLAGLFRYSLDGSRRSSVRLADELEAVRDYLDVESLRLGERLRWRVEVGDDLGRLRVPPLCLQPLVENAVLHGIAPRRSGGEVRVVVAREGEELSMVVEDDGPGPGRSPHRGTGTALADLALRLEVAYGERAGIEEGRSASGGYRVALRVPLRDHGDSLQESPA
jgi:two-component system sensor histidine kinase AlgZ